jgi:hypothetical protein
LEGAAPGATAVLAIEKAGWRQSLEEELLDEEELEEELLDDEDELDELDELLDGEVASAQCTAGSPTLPGPARASASLAAAASPASGAGVWDGDVGGGMTLGLPQVFPGRLM